MTAPISPELQVEAETLWAERDRRVAALTLRQAAEHSHSPSDRLAYALDEWLVTHPEAPVSTAADYPQWAAAMAANQTTPMEAS